jgi:hypothetical protein
VTRRRPGALTHRLLAKVLDDGTMRDVVTPTVADLQFELERAGGSVYARWRVAWRGYAALGRALLVYTIHSGRALRTATTIAALGLAGGALFVQTRRVADDPKIFESALIVPMCLAPLALILGDAPRAMRASSRGRRSWGS